MADEMQGAINRAENYADDVIFNIGQIENEYHALRSRLSKAAEIAQELINDPEMPPGFVEDKAQEILELLS